MNKISKPILLIEDNPMDVELTIRAFKKRKITNLIDVARDGEEALARMASWDTGLTPPVVILLDLKLPKVSGLEVLRQLKAHPQYRTIPVVVLTSSSADRDVHEAYQLGVNSYIVKPVEFEKFVEVAAQIEVYWAVVNKPPL